MPKPILKTGVIDLKDLTPGMTLLGTVRNVSDFGAFVDIGVHQDGLVHKSQMANKFVKHPLDIVKVGDVIKVKIMEVDTKRKRISLTMKDVDQLTIYIKYIIAGEEYLMDEISLDEALDKINIDLEIYLME